MLKLKKRLLGGSKWRRETKEKVKSYTVLLPVWVELNRD